MATNLDDRTAQYIQRVSKLTQRDGMSLEEVLEFMAGRIIELLLARLKSDTLSAEEKLEIFDQIHALTSDDGTVDEQALLTEIDAERGAFNKGYFGTDYAEYAKSRR